MAKLYEKAQDKVLEIVFKHLAPLMPDIKIMLGGGTALSRLYLHHRVSHDLDFLLSGGFDPAAIERHLKQAGLPFIKTGEESGSAGVFASQLHGVFELPGNAPVIQFSFVEDFFDGMFEKAVVTGVPTEVIDGLYHRKLRTISGTGTTTTASGREVSKGQRQLARDLFDVFVLDSRQEPADKFIDRINEHGAGFPAKFLQENIGAIPWQELIDDAESIEPIVPFEIIGAMDLKRYFDDIYNRLEKCHVQ